MTKLKAFFYVFFKSLTSPAYYKDIVASKFSLSLKYFLILAFLSSVVITVSSSSELIGLETTANKFIDSVRDHFPSDLIVTVKAGELSTNKTEPVIFPLNIDVKKSQVQNVKIPLNALVVDVNGTIDDLDKYQTIVLVNKSNLIVKDEQGKIKVSSLKD